MIIKTLRDNFAKNANDFNKTSAAEIVFNFKSKLISSLLQSEIGDIQDEQNNIVIASKSPINVPAQNAQQSPIHNFTLQLLLLFVLVCIIGVLFLSIQAFVEYEKFKQLYGDELNIGLILKNLFKSIYVRLLVYKQKKIFFRRGHNIKQTQFDLLKSILKQQFSIYEKSNEVINNELEIKKLFYACKNDSDLENIYKTKLGLYDKNFYMQYMSAVNENVHQLKLNEQAISMNTLNWLVEKPQVFYGELFSFYSNTIPHDYYSNDDISVGSGYFKIRIYSNSQTPTKLYDHGIIDEDFCFYTQTTYALSRTSITVLHCLNMYVLFRIFNFILNDWQTMCDSIEKGVFLLPPQLEFKIDTLFRRTNTYNRFRQEKLKNILKPNPKRANELRALFRRLSNEETNAISVDTKSIAVKIWPNLDFVITSISGTLNCQLSLIRDYLSKSVKIVSHMHTCDKNLLLGYSMHCYNVDGNTQSEEPIFVSTYDQTYFEYIDTDLIKESMGANSTNENGENQVQLETLKINEIKLNKEYEIVITNYSSIYRYRTGHVIKFIRAHNKQPPLYTYQYRIENWLNLGDIYLNEKIILKKLNLISQLSKCLIVDYTTCVYDIAKVNNNNLDIVEREFYRKIATNDNMSCFILFIEFKALRNSECALKLKLGIGGLFDEYIQNASKEYALLRKENKIDKFRVYELKTGAFEVYKNYLFNEKYKRTGHMEYETPRKLTDFYDAHILLSMKLD